MNGEELYINGNLVDLSDDTVIALTKQVNDIADLESRQGDFTNKFKVPKTTRNREIFGFSQAVQSSSSIPYRKCTVKYVSNGVEVFPSGYAVVEEAGLFYGITIYSNNADIFAEIDGLKLSDLTLSSLNHVWDKATIISFNTATEDVIYPIVDYNERIVTANQSQTIYTDSLYPAMFKHSLVKRIIEGRGWTLDEGQFASDDRYKNDLQLFSNERFENSESPEESTTELASPQQQLFFGNVGSPPTREWASYYTGGNWVLVPRYGGGPAFSAIDNLMSPYFEIEDTGNFSANTKWTCPELGRYRFNIVIDLTVTSTIGTGAMKPTFMLWNKTQNVIYFDTFWDGGYNITSGATVTRKLNIKGEGYDINQGDEMFVLAWMNDVCDFDATLTVDNLDMLFQKMPEIIVGGTVEMASQMPDLTQVEFLKAVFQKYAITPVSDGFQKKVTLRTWKELRDNIPVANDWSDLYQEERDQPVKFRIGNYCQQNDLTYKQDAGVPLYYGNGSFNIDDQILDPRGTLIELPYGSSIASLQACILKGSDVQHILAVNNESNNGGKISPRCAILRRYDVADGIKYHDTGDTTETTDLPFCHFALNGYKGLGFDELIDEYYDVVVDILQNCKYLNATFHLKAIHIHRFDHFVPVYISKFSAYFYVNVIKDYVSGKLTAVELIRI